MLNFVGFVFKVTINGLFSIKLLLHKTIAPGKSLEANESTYVSSDVLFATEHCFFFITRKVPSSSNFPSSFLYSGTLELSTRIFLES